MTRGRSGRIARLLAAGLAGSIAHRLLMVLTYSIVLGAAYALLSVKDVKRQGMPRSNEMGSRDRSFI